MLEIDGVRATLSHDPRVELAIDLSTRPGRANKARIETHLAKLLDYDEVVGEIL
ncbi:MAG: hypothetical protein U5K77_04445 [Candidatus Saccharibacteria bacterium]|nr:hypothetical protein [Candidatus Saccharibacteria bacterium]